MMVSRLFAAELAAEELFKIGNVGITNSMLLGAFASGIVTVLLVLVARNIKVRPSGTFVSLFEVAVETVVNLAESIFHSRAKALRFAPLILTLFLFILINNWIGLLPGVGPLTVGEAPLFRAFTADLNGTLALAIFTVVLIQIYAIRELGIANHLKHYFSDKPWNPINFFVGILEILGEFTKMASLSLRLFGNVFAGEVLLVVIAQISGNLAPVATLPFYFLEIFVGFIQAFVFTMLTIVFLSVATHHADEEHTGQVEHHPLDTPIPEQLAGEKVR